MSSAYECGAREGAKADSWNFSGIWKISGDLPPAFIRARPEGPDHYGCAEQQENQVSREIP
jgi:hypothetical protein